MFKPPDQFNQSMFGSFAYEPIIKRNQDHLLVRMDNLLNWSFVERATAKFYSPKGRNAFHPLKIFKLLVLQNLYHLSDRDVCSNTDCNIIFRYFVGLGLTEEVPHWTDLGKFKDRIGLDTFEQLFYQVLREAEKLGVQISNKRNVDSTDIQANVNIARCQEDKQGQDDHTWVDRDTSDKDAKFGHKDKNKVWYGYKSHANNCAETELVTAVITTPANETDESQLIPLIEKEQEFRGQDTVRKQGGDKAYVGHTKELENRKVLDYVIPKDNMKKAKVKKKKNNHYLHLKNLRYKVERKFAEVKNKHGLRKTRYRGRWKVHLQCLLTYLAVNLKRIVNLLIPKIPQLAENY